ncbi:MAG: hypothetical protein ACRD18_08320 [Terriglobia bacterium]
MEINDNRTNPGSHRIDRSVGKGFSSFGQNTAKRTGSLRCFKAILGHLGEKVETKLSMLNRAGLQARFAPATFPKRGL